MYSGKSLKDFSDSGIDGILSENIREMLCSEIFLCVTYRVADSIVMPWSETSKRRRAS